MRFFYPLCPILTVMMFGIYGHQLQAGAPAAPTDGSVRFTRETLTQENDTYHSYYVRWKDNSVDAEGVEVQLRFANAGAFYLVASNRTAFLTPGIPDVTEPDSDGYREAIFSVGAPLPTTIVQIRIVNWNSTGSKIESSSLLIQTRVPSRTTAASPAGILAPTNLQITPPAGNEDGRVQISWNDTSDKEGFFELFLGEGEAPVSYTPVGFIPFGSTSIKLHQNMRLPFNFKAAQPDSTGVVTNIFPQPVLVPGKTYRVALRTTKSRYYRRLVTLPSRVQEYRYDPIPLLSLPDNAAAPAIPAASARESQGVVSGTFTMPPLKAATELDFNSVSATEFQLIWKDNSNNETGFDIEYKPDSASDFIKLSTSPENATSAILPLSQLERAQFRVRVVHSGFSGTDRDTQLPPSTPVGPRTTTSFTTLTAATSGMANTIDLSWEDQSAAEEGYNVYCRESGSNASYAFCRATPQNLNRVSVNSFTIANDSGGVPIFTELTPGVAYDFIVRAVGLNEAVFSMASNIATATPQPGFTGIMHKLGSRNVAFSHSVTTSNEGNRTAINATGLPAGLTINSINGIISGTPTVTGRFNVTLTATFNNSPTATATLAIIIQAPESAPSIAAAIASNITIAPGQVYRLPLADKFTDADSETAVRLVTNLPKVNNPAIGETIDLLLYPSVAPQAVANFMAYVNAGDFTNVLFHRHEPNFVLQTGGYRLSNVISTVPKRPAPINEPGLSNQLWTVAAAKLGARTSKRSNGEGRDERFGYIGHPNSATTDFYININNNASTLDTQNGGFTVYGRVAGSPLSAISGNSSSDSASQQTIKRIRSLTTTDAFIFEDLPVITPVTQGTEPKFTNLVRIVQAGAIPTLRYSINALSSADSEFTEASVNNDTLVIRGLKARSTPISFTVTATDLDGKSNSQTFTTTVSNTYLEPSITVQPISQTITAGATANLVVSALGSNITFQWRKDNVALPGKNDAFLQISDFQAANVGDYDVVISNSNPTTLISQKAKLTLSAPALITGQLASKLVEVGSSLEIEANVTGLPEPTCVWKNGTTVIAGQTSKKLSIPSVKLSDAGSYTVTASNAGGASAEGAGGVATVIVIDKSPRYQNVMPLTAVSMSPMIAGSGLTYQWKKDGNNLTSPTAQSATLSIASASLLDVGNYTCSIGLPAGLGTTESSIIKLSVSSEKPVLNEIIPLNAVAGISFQHALTFDTAPTKAPSKFTVTGLPTGLTCNVNTGVISGTPRSIGTFSLRATASNLSGSSQTMRGTLKVAPIFALTSGSYVARVSPSQPLNQNLGGKLTILLTNNSNYTAVLQMAGETYRSAGSINLVELNLNANAARYRSGINFPRKNRTTLTANVQLDLIDQSREINGTVTDGVSTTQLAGYRYPWNSRYNPLPPIFYPLGTAVGLVRTNIRYNVALTPENDRRGDVQTPQGSGFLALNLTNAGVCTATGRMADGSTVTASTLVGPNFSDGGQLANLFYLYQTLNKNTSSLNGFLTNFGDSRELTTGNLRWIKGQQPLKERTYQPGFTPTTLTAQGGRFFPTIGSNLLNTEDVENNLYALFNDGGLPTSGQKPNISLRLTANNRVVRPVLNPTKTNVSFNARTGGFTGSFEILDGTTKRPARFQGLVVQGYIGEGYFLLPGSQPSITTSTIQSGRVQLVRFFTKQPATTNVATGSNATFSVKLDPTLEQGVTYQWQKNNVNLSNGSGVTGATTANLTLTAVDNDDAASYTCVVKVGDLSEVASKAAQLNLFVENVVATRTPNTHPLPLGSSVTFAVNTSVLKGSGTLTYAWLKNGVLIPNARGSELTILSTATSDNGAYVARVSNTASPNGVSSAPVSLNINPISSVTVSRELPVDPSSVRPNTSVTLKATVNSGATILGYQWRKDGIAIRGATSSSYTFTTALAPITNNYDVLVFNQLSPAGIPSNALPVAVIEPVSNVVITRTVPTTPVVATSSSVTLSASAFGGSLAYQWKKDNVDILGATGQTYTFTTDATAGTPNFSVAVTNPLTTVAVVSSQLAITLVVPVSNVVASKTQPTETTVPQNTLVTLSVTATGTSPTYQWFRGTTLIAGATSASYEFNSGTVAGTTNYSVRVSNAITTAGVTSNSVPVQVAP